MKRTKNESLLHQYMRFELQLNINVGSRPVSRSLIHLLLNLNDFEVIILESITICFKSKTLSMYQMQQISWEVMKVYPLKIYEIRYWSFFLPVTLSVSFLCFMKQAPGKHTVFLIISLRLKNTEIAYCIAHCTSGAM